MNRGRKWGGRERGEGEERNSTPGKTRGGGGARFRLTVRRPARLPIVMLAPAPRSKKQRIAAYPGAGRLRARAARQKAGPVARRHGRTRPAVHVLFVRARGPPECREEKGASTRVGIAPFRTRSNRCGRSSVTPKAPESQTPKTIAGHPRWSRPPGGGGEQRRPSNGYPRPSKFKEKRPEL